MVCWGLFWVFGRFCWIWGGLLGLVFCCCFCCFGGSCVCRSCLRHWGGVVSWTEDILSYTFRSNVTDAYMLFYRRHARAFDADTKQVRS